MNSWAVYLLGVATLPAAYVLIGAVDRSCVWIARRWVRVVCGHYEFRDGYESKRIRVWRPTGTHRSGCVVTVRLTRKVEDASPVLEGGDSPSFRPLGVRWWG